MAAWCGDSQATGDDGKFLDGYCRSRNATETKRDAALVIHVVQSGLSQGRHVGAELEWHR
jgi:hypothetical protein